jgi:hypothetical protein
MQHESNTTKGDCGLLVIVRCYGDEPGIRRVLSITNTAVFVCRQESYEAILAGEKDAPMVGFPVQDVFQFDETAAVAIAAGRAPDWRRLRPIHAAA